MNSRDIPQTGHKGLVEPPRILTIGLPTRLNLLASWAHNLTLDSILVAVLDATKSDRHTDYLGTVIRFLQDEETSGLLSAWGSEIHCAAELLRLSEAWSASPHIGASFPGMPAAKRVSEQLTGGLLSELSTVALVNPPIPALPDNEAQWIAAFRTWTFVQTVDSIFRGGRPNRYLIEVTNKLRLAIDKDKPWLTMFTRLSGPHNSFNGITRTLAASCSELLADQINPVNSPSHQALLRTLRNFCHGKVPDSEGHETTDGHGRFQDFLLLNFETGRVPFNSLIDQHWSALLHDKQFDDADMLTGRSLNFDPRDTEESVIIQAATDENQTPPEQDHQARGLLLSTAEDHQFLPYSWNRPSPDELRRLDEWIEAGLNGHDFNLRVLATFTLISKLTANSMETALSISLSDLSVGDWSCDLNAGSLHKLRPQRYNGWSVTQEAASWVDPVALSLTIHLAPSAIDTLRQLHKNSLTATQLGHLWPKSLEDTPATTFNKSCRKTSGIQRLRSGMLSQALEQHVFTQSRDPVLSELLASHPRTGLGGACAYASYKGAQIHHVLNQMAPTSAANPSAGADPQENAAGSQLSALDAPLQRSITQALAKVNALSLRQDQWVQHHNALTAYVAVVLLAATGARPVSSPFESLSHFDFLKLTLYIEDKVSSNLHQGRLVPIPPAVVTLLRECYLPHLTRLATLVSDLDSSLSRELKNISQGVDSEQLPLFFFLTREPRVRWFEVTETSLTALEIFSWPLPWNLMRHRLPTTLKNSGQNHEIINGITGHGDQGAAPYGPFSMRLWQNDAREVSAPLNAALSALQFQIPINATWPVTTLQSSVGAPTQSCLGAARKFGAMARQSRRNSHHDLAKQQANSEIAEFVANRPLDSLTPQEWETLSLKMLLNDDGRPRTLGTIRYEALRQWISKSWEAHGVRPRIKRRYIPALEENSPFTIDAIGCQKRIAEALQAVSQIASSVAASRTSRRESLALAILMLVLESRIGDPKILNDLLQSGNIRLVLFQQRYYLEHGAGLGKFQDAPVKRFAISAMTAVLLARAKTATNKLDIRQWAGDERISAIWQPFNWKSAPLESFQAGALEIARHVRQGNALEFPGVVAAYFNGEIVSVALRHADWVRVQLGKAAIFEPSIGEPAATGMGVPSDDTDDSVFSAVEMNADYIPSPNVSMGINAGTKNGPPCIPRLQQQSIELFQKIRDELNAELNTKTPSRKNLDVQLRQLLHRYSGTVSRTCILLGEWQRSLLWRKTPKGLIRIRSLSRYLNALSVCFQAIGYDHDLLDCDEDEVTDFYRSVMEVRQLVRPGNTPEIKQSSPDSSPGESGTQEVSQRYRTQGLALQLLRDFHRLVSREFGVDDPDWSEIDGADEYLSISPGMLTENEYLCALDSLAPIPAQASREQLARAFILLTAFRFGLRGDEATGMMREDWVDTQPDALVILVRTNYHRSLKTKAAQRQVPLLFLFDEKEQAIVDHWLASFEGITTLDGAGPLFANQASPKQLMNGKLLRHQVSQVIKQVTRNRDLSLHDARHTFVNRVGLMLIDHCETLWPHASPSEQSTVERSNHVRRLLLSTAQVTSRSLWALARLAGHAHPATTVRSYLHFLPELSTCYVKIPTTGKKPVSKDLSSVCIDLDCLSFRDDYLQPTPVESRLESSSPLAADQALRFLHLCQRGVNIERAREITRTSSEDSDCLIKSIRIVDKILARRPHINPDSGGSFNLLSHIPNTRWAALIEMGQRVVWNADADATALDSTGSDELPQMIGSSRQIILWKPAHFLFFRQVVDAWHLGEQSYLIYTTKRNKDKLRLWANSANLRLADEAASIALQTGSHRESLAKASPNLLLATAVQIDTVHLEDAALTVSQRCGVLPQTHPASRLRSSHELVLLFVVSLTLKSITSRSKIQPP